MVILYIDNEYLYVDIRKIDPKEMYPYSKKEQYIFFIQYLILNIITGLVKIVLGFFYNSVRIIIEMPFSLFCVIISINLILNLYIFLDVFSYLYNYYGYINMYIFLILISMLARFIDRDFKYLKMQYINNFISTDCIINLRIYTTLCGNLIFFIIENRKYNV
jgi:hypothetical protein